MKTGWILDYVSIFLLWGVRGWGWGKKRTMNRDPKSVVSESKRLEFRWVSWSIWKQMEYALWWISSSTLPWTRLAPGSLRTKQVAEVRRGKPNLWGGRCRIWQLGVQTLTSDYLVCHLISATLASHLTLCPKFLNYKMRAILSHHCILLRIKWVNTFPALTIVHGKYEPLYNC